MAQIGESGGKAASRKAMRAMRKAVSEAGKAAAEASIAAQLEARSDVRGAKTIAAYLASPDEICLDAFIARAIARGVAVFVPRWDGRAYGLARLRGFGENDLRRGPMGIREPVEADIAAPEDVDLWIVPGLAFTRDGKRLGYGGGWYDRLMAGAAPGAARIAVAYGFQIVEDLPAEPHDVKMTDVVCGRETGSPT